MAANTSRLPRTPSRDADLRALRLHGPVVAGRTSSVHLGWLEAEQRLVAVKRLHPQHGADEIAVARVLAEARRAGRVVHPNVVATLGLVRRPGDLLAVLDYVPAASLAEVCAVSADGLAPALACSIVAGALRGLHAAHEARGMLREIASRRVLVGEDGRARLLDFSAPVLPATEAALEKLPYAAPEQLLRQPLGVRRDVYAMAVVLWETLAGRPLFLSATPTATLRKILVEHVLAPSRFAAGISPALDAIVLRGLARDPAARFATPLAMAGELERAGCASTSDVARALMALDLACVRRRRALADSVCITEVARCTSSAAQGI